MITKLNPKYATCDFNFEAIGAVSVSPERQDEIVVAGNFRSKYDYIGVSWLSEDTWSHAHNKYPTSTDYTDVILSYDYHIEGSNAPMDSEQAAPVITIFTTSGSEYYVRLWNYTVNRPTDDWEEGSGTLFPADRTPGNANGTTGHIVIDFNNLYAGWRAFDDTYPVIGYDEEGNPITDTVWVPSSDWVKINPSEIKEIMFGFNAVEYDNLDPTPLADSYSFKVTMSNWTVTGDIYLGPDIQPLPPHLYRLCDGYDDSYNITPCRLIEEFYNLGFRKVINIYIGCSHFYDKKSDGTPTPEEYEPYRYVIKTDKMFNAAFELWWKDLLAWAKHYGFEEVIGSTSMESVNAPPGWWQRTADGQPGITLWTPTPHLISFCNEEVIAYYKKYVKAIADMQHNAGLPISVQLGEPWWWWREDLDTDPPCFYDDATRQAHRNTLGYDIPEWYSAWEDFTGHEETLQFLRRKNGEFAWILRDYIRSFYPASKFAVLFFPPSVLDVGRAPKMMQMVNFPQEYWKNIANNLYLDFFQIEDYDYLLFNQVTEHAGIYNFVWNYLQYQFHRTHYFAGFYPSEEILEAWPNVVTDGLWDRINEAAIDGINEEFESFIWAGPEIRIYDWMPPPMKWKAKKAKLNSVAFYGE